MIISIFIDFLHCSSESSIKKLCWKIIIWWVFWNTSSKKILNQSCWRQIDSVATYSRCFHQWIENCRILLNRRSFKNCNCMTTIGTEDNISHINRALSKNNWFKIFKRSFLRIINLTLVWISDVFVEWTEIKHSKTG
jgi:hypothetical protein